MAIVQGLVGFAVRQLLDGACAAVGVKESGDAIVGFLTNHFTDHSQRLAKALQEATDRAWQAVEIALAGESLLGRLDRAEDRAFRQQVRAFLDAAPNSALAADPAFRQRCLRELRAARKAGRFAVGRIDPTALGEFKRFSDAPARLDVERKMLKALAHEFAGDYPDLARLLELEPQPGQSLLVVGFGYFFRRAVEDDSQLFRGLTFAKIERFNEAQEQGFAALDVVLEQQGQRLETLLGDLQVLVAETHGAVLDLQVQMEGQGEQVRQIGHAVQKLLEQHQLQKRELRPGDSLSIRNDGERQLVKQLVARYRALPDGDRQQVPALLNAIGKLEVVAGDFDAARHDFQTVALLERDDKGKAEAHYNAYLASLEKRDWSGAIQELVKAVKLDAKRFAPFPVGKYQPARILGAGGFGVAYLCKHRYMDAQVVVKTLTLDNLGRDTDKVFTEAQVMRELDHPAIIRISDCGYVDGANKSRPFLVMDYFPPGITLEEYVKTHGPLAVDDLLAVAQVAEGLHAAHGKGILHRDVKPANLLVRKDGAAWQVKVIDFGLALRQQEVEKSSNASTTKHGKTLLAESTAGTVDYAAPEQMGRCQGIAPGPYSDVYGWAKSCCYAPFATTQPLPKHWHSIPAPLTALLEQCLDPDPNKRLQGFAHVLEKLHAGNAVPPRAQPVIAQQLFDFAQPKKDAVRQRPVVVAGVRSPGRRLPFLIGGGVALATLISLIFVGVLALRAKTKAGTPLELVTVSSKNKTKNDTMPSATSKEPATGASLASQECFLRFAGRDHVELENSRGLIDYNGEYTIEAWVRLNDSVPGCFAFVSNEVWPGMNPAQPVSNASGWTLRANPDKLGRYSIEFVVGAKGKEWFGVTTPHLDKFDVWHHLAVCKSERIALFCDGKLQAEKDCRGITFMPAPQNEFLGISKTAFHDRVFKGDFREVRFSSKSRYRSNFVSESNWSNDEATLLLMRFGSPVNSTVQDLSGHGRHGVFTGRFS